MPSKLGIYKNGQRLDRSAPFPAPAADLVPVGAELARHASDLGSGSMPSKLGIYKMACD
jgi:hypothetical protein